MGSNYQSGFNNWLLKKGIGLILSRYFSVVYTMLPPEMPLLDVPTIYYANHSAGWDPFFALYLSTYIYPTETYIMASDHIVNSYPFLKRFGLFSVDRTNVLTQANAITYSADLIKGSKRALWIFPQGQIRPFFERPLVLKKGIVSIIRKVKNIRVVPVIFHYTFSLSPRAEAYIIVGEAKTYDKTAVYEEQQVFSYLDWSLNSLIHEMDCKLSHPQNNDFVLSWKKNFDLVLLPLNRKR